MSRRTPATAPTTVRQRTSRTPYSTRCSARASQFPSSSYWFCCYIGFAARSRGARMREPLRSQRQRLLSDDCVRPVGSTVSLCASDVRIPVREQTLCVIAPPPQMEVEAVALAVTIRLGHVIHLLPVHVGHFGPLRRRSVRIFGRIAIGPKRKRQNILHADQFQAAVRP